MRGRSALSEPAVVRRLQQDFIPAVGAHEVLTRGPWSEWWSSLVRSANPRFPGGSTQGYYLVAPDGTGLLWDNYLPRLESFLERAAQAARLHRDRGAPDGVPAPDPTAPPEGTSVLQLFTRIRPLPAGAGPMNGMLGRDSMWVLRDEVRGILNAPGAGAGAESFALPRSLVYRLVLFHLVDNVRGQVWPWRRDSISRARMTARLVRSSGTRRTYSLSGDYARRDSRPPQWTDRGQEGTLEGEFELDAERGTIVRFRALARSTAWSDAGYDRNAPPPPGRYPVLTAIVEASTELARRVPPEMAAAGAYYLRGGW